MDKDFVSVIIPTHNRADIVERAVKSVLNQTYQKFEIIVISDGSEDNTDAVMERICNEDPRIRYISYHPAKGGNIARNIGIDNAKCDFIAFLDDDDEWHPDKIEKQLSVFSRDKEIGLVCTGTNGVYLKENARFTYIPPAPYDSSRKILIKNCIGSTTTVMIRAELLRKCGKFDPILKALQDYDLWIRICQETKIGVVAEPCVEYYNYSGNNQISQNTEKYVDAIDYISHKYNSLIKTLSKKEMRLRNRVMTLLVAKKGLRNGECKLVRQYSFELFRNKFFLNGFICLIGSFLPFGVLLKLRKHIQFNK